MNSGVGTAQSVKKADDATMARMQSEVLTKLDVGGFDDLAKNMVASGRGSAEEFDSCWSGINLAEVKSLVVPDVEPDRDPVKKELPDDDDKENHEDEEGEGGTGSEGLDPEGSNRGKNKGKGKGKGEAWFDRDTVVNKAKRLWLNGVGTMAQQMENTVTEAHGLLRELKGNAENVHFKHAYPVLSRRKVVASAILNDKCQLKDLHELLTKVDFNIWSCIFSGWFH